MPLSSEYFHVYIFLRSGEMENETKITDFPNPHAFVASVEDGPINISLRSFGVSKGYPWPV